MSGQADAQSIEAGWVRLAFRSETVLVEDDADFEGHGLLSGAALAAAVIVMGAGGTMVAHSGSALAPEPAKLGATSLGSSVSSTTSAAYVNSGVQTTVLNWPSSFRHGANVAVGTPCSPVGLAAYSTTRYVIVAMSPGSAYKKCI